MQSNPLEHQQVHKQGVIYKLLISLINSTKASVKRIYLVARKMHQLHHQRKQGVMYNLLMSLINFTINESKVTFIHY